ncbi:type II toxin-antitoxin system VapC family toxin [Phyllobacterium chamaecytisi]|uniref:type II toxin-antitoxin system VapC family toxin n=1 Tax=Phyllobacterium chamaecytisi TaxID=2876082 RepID=UPI001CC9E4C0|nr:type II toxin-antitoxin system VapC family toxin [Phyllobacterium sp. KW56]MBZ9602485.1 type II toxin-antitoxin system VapC family toxin [Phyllobacterium sp. KW56]
MFILDTNVISELRLPKKANSNVLSWASGIPLSSFFLSSMTVMETERGILLMERKDFKQGAVLRTWLENRILPDFQGRILGVDIAVALCCAGLHVPNPKSERDALIAATALVHGMTVVTRNVADFQSTGVSIFNPWNA